MFMTRSTLIHNAQAKPTGMSDDLLCVNQEEKDGEDLCICSSMTSFRSNRTGKVKGIEYLVWVQVAPDTRFQTRVNMA